ncbi:MAG: hypothetical protein ACK6EB_42540, partial [Planctomyces sp.]
MLLKFVRVHLIARVLVALVFGNVTVAQDTPTATESPFRLVSDVLGELQRLDDGTGDILVNQRELDELIAKSGGGACPSAAAIIATQTLRGMAG